MLEFRAPVPVSTPLGEGYALYVTNGGAKPAPLSDTAASAQRLAAKVRAP